MQTKRLITKAIGLGINAVSALNKNWAGRLAYDLFTHPFPTKLRPKERDFLATAVQHRTERAERNIVEYHWGKTGAPYILLSYGWVYNAGRWRHFVPQLVEAGYRVIAYDPPSHGLSPRKQLHLVHNINIIRDIIQTYGAPFATVAHSFGGAAMVGALAHLDRSYHPQRMVTMAAFSHGMAVFRGFQRELGLNEGPFQVYLQYLLDNAGDLGGGFDLLPLTERLAHIPNLLIHDPQDKVTPAEQSQRYHLNWPGSILLTPIGAGHHLGTARVTEAILDFVIDQKIPLSATVQERPLPAAKSVDTYYAAS
ncbi:MAG: alpha/beta fold hydrolase [Bacteroidota bacterium]